jgi:hypothetical protein
MTAGSRGFLVQYPSIFLAKTDGINCADHSRKISAPFH